MPGLDGIEATRRLLSVDPDVGVLVLTMFEVDDSVLAAMRAGVRGYLLKGAEQEEILRAIRAIAAGSGSARAAFPALTEREREVLDLIAAGKGNAAIAHELVLTLKTVRNHVSNIFGGKLQVADRAAVIVKARDAGFGPSPGRG
jgi:DNA-binding NarL/FixJ family response regulator